MKQPFRKWIHDLRTPNGYTVNFVLVASIWMFFVGCSLLVWALHGSFGLFRESPACLPELILLACWKIQTAPSSLNSEEVTCHRPPQFEPRTVWSCVRLPKIRERWWVLVVLFPCMGLVSSGTSQSKHASDSVGR